MTLRIIFFVCWLLSTTSIAQQLDKIGQEKPFRFSGNVGVEQIIYGGSNSLNDRDPYSYIITATLNTQLYGWSIPVSFTLSNYNSSFLQPFNQFGIRPTYKNLKLYVGYSSMIFNPYSLNGHIFLGAGAEYKSDSGWLIGLMGGRLRRASVGDSLQTESITSFRRMGLGVKVGYDKQDTRLILSAFSAYDDINSLDSALLDPEQQILPSQNFVLSIDAARKFSRHWRVALVAARSSLTRDLSLADTEGSNFLITSNASTYSYHAVQSQLEYTYKSGSVGVKYERIDPGFETMGAYYFNRDLENASVFINQRMSPISFTGRVGIQRNNLDDTQISEMRRVVGSASLSYSGKGGSLQARYSTFNTFTNIRPAFADLDQLTPFDNFDTLNYRQVNNSAALSGVIPVVSKGQVKHSITINTIYQGTRERQSDLNSLDFFNLIFGYLISDPTQSISMMIIANSSSTFQSDITRVGPTISYSRSFLERKLRLVASGSSSWQQSSSVSNSSILLLRLSGSYRLQESHRLRLSIIYRNLNNTNQERSGADLNVNLGYNYSF